MSKLRRILSILVFSTLFVLLVGSLLAQANAQTIASTDTSAAKSKPNREVNPGSGFRVEPTDSFYPMEMIRYHTRLRPMDGQIPWYVKKSNIKYRIFNAGGMQAQIRKWDHFEKDVFLRRLDTKGARGVASLYAQFTPEQLTKAEAELRKVKEEK